MNSESFNRIKKMVRREGKVVFADNDDAFVILPFGEYEMLTDGLYGEECECDDENCDCSSTAMSSLPNGHHEHDFNFDKDFNFSEEILMDNNEDAGKPVEVKKEDDGADKDLIKRVNEDIAKWREEQDQSQEHKNIKTPSFAEATEGRQEQEERMLEKSVDMGLESKKDNVLTEEERYYLEPLE